MPLNSRLQQQTTDNHRLFEHGSHNVSRWMTWLPISLKNAAKCDKWYQLQNHLITESLNAKGAWEQLFVSDPQACRIAQCRTKTQLRGKISIYFSKVESRFEYCLSLAPHQAVAAWR